MKKERFEEIIANLKLEKKKWMTLTEIESIILNDGRGIYPNWVHMRFLLTDDSIIIKHGESEPYGSRFNYRFAISNDACGLSFPPGAVLIGNPYIENFRLPKAGDIIRSTIGVDKVLSESLISRVYNASNSFTIDVVNPIRLTGDAHLSFYDPQMYNKNECIHGTEVEGIYTRFSENKGKNKKFGVQHEVINIRNIKEINLKLSKAHKTYKLK